VNLEEQKKILREVKSGDVFETGHMFSHMAPENQITWQVIEAKETEEGRRVTLHLYYQNVFLAPIIGLITKNNSIGWTGSCISQV